MVVAKAKAARPDAPHVLFYGHYDVQPVDPLDLVESRSFDARPRRSGAGPQADRGARRGRRQGPADDLPRSLPRLRANGGLPCHVTILFEGEEESGSTSLPAFLAENGRELKADIMLVCDTNMWNRDTPLITCMLRGLALEEVIVKAASRDLHSGMFGGPAVNPIHVLSHIIAGLHDENGRITLPDFYEDVPELPPEIKEQWAALDFNDEGFSGRGRPVGSRRRSRLFRAGTDLGAADLRRQRHHRRLYRARLENRTAGASQRQILLPPRRKRIPQAIVERFRAYVRARLPEDCEAEFLSHGASPALSCPSARKRLRAPAARLKRNGASRPCWPPRAARSRSSALFKRELKMDLLMVGFGLDDDRIHSPNEKYELSSFQKGARSWARILTALAD